MTKNELRKIFRYILYESILYESKQTQINKYGKDLVNKLLPLDPTKTYKYIEAICSYYNEGIDENTIKDYINKFDELQNKNILKNKDINSYKTFDKLKQAVDSTSFKTKRSTKKEVYGKPYKTIKNDKGTWLIYKPTTKEESCLLGKNTKWCTQQKKNNQFNNYYIEINVDFYYIINKETQDKYQIVLMKGDKIEEIRDSADELITTSKFEELTDIDPHQFKFDKTNLNGEYVTKYNNGNIRTITHYKNGKLDGEYIYYYKNGHPETKCNYKNGKLDGKYEEYYEYGIYKKCNYKNGKLDGKYEEYHKNGNMFKKCNYKNGKLDGELMLYNKDGSPRKKYTYKNDILNGECIEYYSNGSIKAKYNYINDKKNGEQFFYYKNGNIEEKYTYKNGKLDGEYIGYDSNGKIDYKYNYKNDKLDGEYFEYTEDGKVKEHKLYKNGKVVKNYLKENITKAELKKAIKYILYESILYESKQTQINKYGKDLVNKLLPLDPSKTYKYIEAICSYYNEGIDENIIKDYIDKFDMLQNKNLLKNKDINQYKTFNQLKQAVDSSSFTTKRSIKKEVYGKPYKTIENNKGTWLVYKPTTKEESCLLGKNTKWCTQQINNNKFNRYYWSKNLDLFYIINKETQDKYQIVVNEESKLKDIFNSADDPITVREFKDLTGIDPYQFKFNRKKLDDGTRITRYDDGDIKSITHYKHGVLDGECKEYNEDGDIYMTCNYKNGKVDGELIFYYGNGRPERKFNYKNGKLNGEYTEYFENGNIREKYNYKNDTIDGKYIKYYPNGNIEYEFNYVNGDKNGEQFSYYRNGNIEEESHYKNDELDGEYIAYTEDGKIEEHELYKNGKIIKDYLDGDNYD